MDLKGRGGLGSLSSWLLPVLCFLLIVCCAPVFAEAAGTETAHAKSLVLMYIVGSDLESGEGHAGGGGDGTTDIMSIIDGYGNTSPEDLNIIVGYGGSKQPGWEGMTIATIADLKKDAADGIIGNEGIGEFIDQTMDMGAEATLSTFLSKTKEKYDGDHTYLIFWNHGNGFEGFGWDENSGNHLSLSAITSALEQSGRKYDLIGFDACLMAGLEVARAMSPYARYLIGSEEISAGGWTYAEWVSALAKNPEQDPASIGRIIIDSFFHRDEPSGNTAALIDLSGLEPVQKALDELGTDLNRTLLPDSSIVPIARAYEKTTRFGENFDEGKQQALKIDLGTLANYLVEALPETKEAGNNLKIALKDAVVYEHHDELMSNATGLSIADPLTLPETDYEEIADILSISPGWDAFVQAVRSHIKQEIETPDVVSVGTNTYSLKDVTGSESVSVAYFSINNTTGELLQLGTMPALTDENGSYVMPEWDGEWYYLQDSRDPDQVALIDLYYGDTTGTGISKYLSEVNIVRNMTPHTTLLYSYIDPDTYWTRYSLRPYDVENNQTIFSRSGFTPKAGDTLLSYALGYDMNGTEIGMKQLGEMTLTGTLDIHGGILPDGEYGWAILAESADGKTDTGDIRLLSIHDGVVHQGNHSRGEAG